MSTNKDSNYRKLEQFPAALITTPGANYASSDLAGACAELVLAPGKSAAVKQ